MAAKPVGTPADAEIRALIADWARAIRAKDVNAAMRHYAADVVAFDLAPPLQYAGADALKTSLAAWFPTFRGPVGYDIRELDVTAGEDVAFLPQPQSDQRDPDERRSHRRVGACDRRAAQDRRDLEGHP